MGLVINQRKYTIDLLKETRKIGCRSVSIPIKANYNIKSVYAPAAERVLLLEKESRERSCIH